MPLRSFLAKKKKVFRNLVLTKQHSMLSMHFDALLPYILASFLELNDFITNFIAEEIILYSFFFPELTVCRNSLSSAFSFRLYSSKGKCLNYFRSFRKIVVKLKYLIVQMYIYDT